MNIQHQSSAPSLIAYYLPQFHPVAENDLWWGKGFTEWTNVAKAKPLFKGHRQPKLPGELGFYDLRIPEVREQQADMARAYGIDAFCYWHYWFGEGKSLLEYPIHQVLKTQKPDFPFCFAWANQTWGGLPYGDGFERILMEQKYPGKEDFIAHYNYVRPFFLDERYVKVDNKPFFQINISAFSSVKLFMETWHEMANADGFDGMYFVAHDLPDFDHEALGYDALSFQTPAHMFRLVPKGAVVQLKEAVYRRLGISEPDLFDYQLLLELQQKHFLELAAKKPKNYLPVAIPNWDHSPRSGKKAKIILNSNPSLFEQNLEICHALVENTKSTGIIMIKAWNEWAEGNILEPEAEHGMGYLEACKRFSNRKKSRP